MRVAINLLTKNPQRPWCARWFWTQVIPEMANRLEPGDTLDVHREVAERREHPRK